MEIYIFFLVLICVYIVSRLWKKKSSGSKLPPSLPSLPVVGSLPFLSKLDKLHLCLTKKSKSYGNVFSFMAGQRYTVVLNGHAAIREALITKSTAFAGRGKVYVHEHIYSKETTGIILRPYGENYEGIKSVCMSILKKLGYGNSAVMEKKIQEQALAFIRYAKSLKGVTWNPAQIIELSVASAFLSLLFGGKYGYEDSESIYLTALIRRYSDSVNPIFDVFPLVIHIPYFRKLLSSARLTAEEVDKFNRRKIDECIANEHTGENFVTEFLKRTKNINCDIKDLINILLDLFSAGFETTSGQLRWAIVLIGNRPQIMARLYDDIDSVVPRCRFPSLSDQTSLPYVEATILEVLRYSTTLPLAVPHLTLCDTDIGGYTIPCDSHINNFNIEVTYKLCDRAVLRITTSKQYTFAVLVNLWSAHMDPDVWGDPEIFRPERFLNENGDVINREKMIAFSLGKRSCLGERLARQELFLFLTAILQNFEILPPHDQTCIKEKAETIYITSAAASYELRLVART